MAVQLGKGRTPKEMMDKFEAIYRKRQDARARQDALYAVAISLVLGVVQDKEFGYIPIKNLSKIENNA